MKSPYSTYLNDEAATDALGHRLAACLMPGLVIFLHGDLGAGKTALTRAMLHAAGVTGHVKSPTYALAESYQLELKHAVVTATHFDLYRMASAEEFLDAGFRELFGEQAVCIVEWPERGAGVLPVPDLEVWLTVAGQGRHVELQAKSDKGSACLDQLKFAPNL